VRSGPDGGDRDLEAALVALIEVALSGLERDGSGDAVPADQARGLARAMAGVVREVIRAPLREALQAGYELGLRAARDAQTTGAATPTEPGLPAVPSGLAGPPLPAVPSALVGPPSPAAPSAAAPTDASHLPLSAGIASRVQPAPRASTRAPAGEVVVEVSPFTSFADVNRFHAAVAGAPGVARAAIVAFRGGRLRLRVNHPDVRVLATTLDGLDVGPLRVVRMAPDALELLLTTTGAPRPPE
jgi:hypothetical protein